jgi:uncharacterized protein (DUF362 family)
MKPKVSISRVYNQNTYAALKEAIDRLGGLSRLIPPGSTVLIKPNYVMSPTERGITSHSVVEAIVRLAASASPGRLLIGEGSADSYTPTSFRLQNTYDLAARYDAECIDLNNDETVSVTVPEEAGRSQVILPKTMAECDVLISVPIFKLWMGKMPMTLSLKNLFGCLPACVYGHNKTSNNLAETEPFRTLEGEVGSEQGAHLPSPEHTIAAVNLARTSDIQIIDALEGSDGKGNYVRMDTLIVGTNPVATDSVGLAIAGFVPEDQKQMELSSSLGLGPCRLEEIEVVGEPIESVCFDLRRIPDNILELPLEYCLARIHTDEFVLIERGLKFYNFLPSGEVIGKDRKPATAKIMSICLRDGFLDRALDTLPENAKVILRRFVDLGGTSNSYFKLLDDWVGEYKESNSFWVGIRALIRLGLLFIFGSQHKPYIILREGVIDMAKELHII